MMQLRAGEKQVLLKLLPEGIQNDRLLTDPLRLKQVLINLISNAIKFSAPGSEVIIKARELGSKNGYSTYRFEVLDYGTGMSEDQISRLFKPFEQADTSITRQHDGTGLGLVIGKNLVELMGGKINVLSRKGEGSIFSFTVYCAARPVRDEKSAGDALSMTNYDFSGKRCLVVDDIDINREIVTELLSETKMQIDLAVNGLEAVEKFKAFKPGYFDVILMDIQMPEMDGYTATREIRQIEKETGARQIPIIAITANVLPADIQRAFESGMSAHLGKPIDLETTLKTMQEHMSRMIL
jgi:CheY-like chemotaxis protein